MTLILGEFVIKTNLIGVTWTLGQLELGRWTLGEMKLTWAQREDLP